MQLIETKEQQMKRLRYENHLTERLVHRTIGKFLHTVVTVAALAWAAAFGFSGKSFAKEEPPLQMAQQTGPNIVAYASGTGTECNSTNSLIVRIKNFDNRTGHYCIYIERSSGKWDRSIGTLRPVETTSAYVCHSTGKFQVLTKAENDDSSFPERL